MPDKKDFFDMVQTDFVLKAAGMQVGAYRVRDVETGEFGKQHFHMTYNNYVMAAMGEEAFKLMANLIFDSRPDLLADRHKTRTQREVELTMRIDTSEARQQLNSLKTLAAETGEAIQAVKDKGGSL
jgi:hypothetical protein